MTVTEAKDVLARDPAGPPPPRPLTLATPAARAARAAVSVEGATPRTVDLVWVRLAEWKLLLTADSADGSVEPRLVHGLDPRLLTGALAVSVELDLLPGPGQAQTIASLPRREILRWPFH